MGWFNGKYIKDHPGIVGTTVKKIFQGAVGGAKAGEAMARGGLAGKKSLKNTFGATLTETELNRYRSGK